MNKQRLKLLSEEMVLFIKRGVASIDFLLLQNIGVIQFIVTMPLLYSTMVVFSGQCRAAIIEV